MKRLALLSIPLLTAAAAFGGISANAAIGGTIYPEDSEFVKTLELTSLTDYAVEGGLYAFAEGKTVKVYDDGKYSEYAFENDVTGLDIKESVIYCGCSDGKAYTLTEQTECEYSFPEKTNEILFNGYYYFTDESGLNIFNKSTKENETYEGVYSDLKLYGETVYAIGDGTLYSFTDSKRSEVVLEYAVDKTDLKINIGQAATLLKKYSQLKFVKVEANSYMTEIDLEKLDGEYFEPLSVAKTEEEITALLLCYSGNAAIVAAGSSAYAVLKEKTSETVLDCAKEIPFENAQMIGGNIYASPFVVSGTTAYPNAIGNTVKILNKYECDGILETTFYEVEFGNGEKGYVAEGFLSKVIIEDVKKPVEVTDPAYSENNDTKTILIIFAVVLLVLAAIAYISHIGSKGKKNKKKKDKDKKEE